MYLLIFYNEVRGHCNYKVFDFTHVISRLGIHLKYPGNYFPYQ